MADGFADNCHWCDRMKERYPAVSMEGLWRRLVEWNNAGRELPSVDVVIRDMDGCDVVRVEMPCGSLVYVVVVRSNNRNLIIRTVITHDMVKRKKWRIKTTKRRRSSVGGMKLSNLGKRN